MQTNDIKKLKDNLFVTFGRFCIEFDNHIKQREQYT